MRCLALTAVLAVVVTPARADDSSGEKGRPADKGVFGIGLALGEPVGISAKLYVRDDQAIQAVIGSAFAAGGIQVHVDYVFHPWILQDKDTFVLPVYLGPGLRFIDYIPGEGAADHIAIGLRAVIGMLFDFKNVPLDVFLEVAPVGEYDFGGGSAKSGFGVSLNGDAGVRYYF